MLDFNPLQSVLNKSFCAKAIKSFLCVLIIIVSGCSQTQVPPNGLSPNTRINSRVDFSGHWEKNFQASDDINNKYELLVHTIRNIIDRNNRRMQTSGAITPVRASQETLSGLVQLTDEITKVTLLEITQDDSSIFIDREGNFALDCDYFTAQFSQEETAFGNETCGWNNDQFIFHFDLYDGLSIHHQVTMGPDNQQLNITTTVSSGSVSEPLTISTFYQRYTPVEDQFDCLFTLSHNNVCRQKSS